MSYVLRKPYLDTEDGPAIAGWLAGFGVMAEGDETLGELEEAVVNVALSIADGRLARG